MTAMPNRRRLTATMLLLGALAPVAAQAHPGHEAGSSLVAGLMHPLTGLDHVLMIVAVSIWAAALPPRGRWLVAGFLGAFVAMGALLPVSPGAGLEAAIAATVVGAGALLAIGRRWPAWATGALAGVFALVHGFAHGAEGPAASALYVPGLVIATSGLALLVSSLVAWLQPQRAWLRTAGAVTAASGAMALLG